MADKAGKRCAGCDRTGSLKVCAPHEWFNLPPSQRTRAIYCELRQLLDSGLHRDGFRRWLRHAQTVLANSERT